jgi:SH3-like domain-containing protein
VLVEDGSRWLEQAAIGMDEPCLTDTMPMTKRCLTHGYRGTGRSIAGCLFAVLLALFGAAEAWAQDTNTKAPPALDAPASGLKPQRYGSLKADRVQLRQGPGADQPTAGTFEHMGLPVEILQEHETWSRVRDAGGTVGWVPSTALSRRRTALILPWEVKRGKAQSPLAVLRDDDRENARAIAQVEAGVLAGIISCENNWCRVSVGNYRGYIEQAKLWGTFPNEEIK